jgi:hypothetical protein
MPNALAVKDTKLAVCPTRWLENIQNLLYAQRAGWQTRKTCSMPKKRTSMKMLIDVL